MYRKYAVLAALGLGLSAFCYFLNFRLDTQYLNLHCYLIITVFLLFSIIQIFLTTIFIRKGQDVKVIGLSMAYTLLKLIFAIGYLAFLKVNHIYFPNTLVIEMILIYIGFLTATTAISQNHKKSNPKS